ncbi:MAG: SH3 domain-containing protein [Aggregatilineales bacterium]
MPRTFQRSLALTLALGTLITAALACNLPGISQTANQTLTAAANLVATTTGLASLTAAAQSNVLSSTQTALVPTVTNTPVPSDTLPPSDTPVASVTLPPGVTPTQTSIALGSLKVGVEALVSTTAGSTLFLRDSAGKKGAVLAQMPSDTRVRIVDGPQAGDGSLWWKVQVLTSGSSSAIGKTGWCIESDGKIQTLTAAK